MPCGSETVRYFFPSSASTASLESLFSQAPSDLIHSSPPIETYEFAAFFPSAPSTSPASAGSSPTRNRVVPDRSPTSRFSVPVPYAANAADRQPAKSFPASVASDLSPRLWHSAGSAYGVADADGLSAGAGRRRRPGTRPPVPLRRSRNHRTSSP